MRGWDEAPNQRPQVSPFIFQTNQNEHQAAMLWGSWASEPCLLPAGPPGAGYVGTGQALVKQQEHGALQKAERWDGASTARGRNTAPAGRISQAQWSSQGGCGFQSLRNTSYNPEKALGWTIPVLCITPGQGSPERKPPWNGRAEEDTLASLLLQK